MYNDEHPAHGTNIYRLKITGLSGTSYYSDASATIISGSTGNEAIVTLFPNPAGNLLNITWTNAGVPFLITLFNSIGHALQVIRTTKGSVSVDMSQLAAGFYLVQWTQGGQAQRPTFERTQ